MNELKPREALFQKTARSTLFFYAAWAAKWKLNITHLSHPLFALLDTWCCYHSKPALFPDSINALLAALRHDLFVKLLQAGEQRSAGLQANTFNLYNSHST